MSTTTAPPMLPPPAPADAQPPEGEMGDEAQQAILAMASVADEVFTAAASDPVMVKKIVETALKDPDILAMLQQALGQSGGGMTGDEEPSGSFEADLEALVSSSDDIGEITDADLAMMAE